VLPHVVKEVCRVGTSASATTVGRLEVSATKGWEGSVLLALLLFVGVGAVYGGIGLMVNGMGMPGEWLDRLPVDAWTWPGVALLLTVAVPQFAAAVLVTRHDPRAGLVGIVVGAALVLWILVQLAVLQRYFFLQPLIAGIGLLEVLVSWAWVRRSRPAGS
jgi:hypothetical protein